ncbi:two-component system, CitB family, response regulator [Oceanospirillum multiglobuliferum]|uniref:Transcriptional regulatory protein n=1 Tax=Oceanospirillum multiglobuliferum TaxID=64969 RepID=A0A1T4N6I2_9GAMM|nr:response regulator [Oceanospirillum multiglobuliferum]OPX55858.1 two-component system response regulator [Oceanospirillum multiglobuliferum]SJZ74920.1 two-component system, CitB family, response regulator [Oceanospirillum multiglobuliferum]
MADHRIYRIVIAEDDHRIAEIQQRFIEKIPGFQVEAIALTLADAKELVNILQPDLLLLDIHFPEGTGLELLAELRGQHQDTDVILITAAKEASTLQAALRGGVFDYILKPLIFDRLQAALQNYSRHREQLNQLLQQANTLAQQDVDQLLPRNEGSERGQVLDGKSVVATEKETETEQSNPKKLLPKGIDALTLDKIRQVFNGAQTKTLSAEEVGEVVGASRTTARRYLEYLVSEGELVADVSYGSVGRPERRYSAIP